MDVGCGVLLKEDRRQKMASLRGKKQSHYGGSSLKTEIDVYGVWCGV